MKILVADDSRVMRQIVIRTLRQAGYDDHDIVDVDGVEGVLQIHTDTLRERGRSHLEKP